MTSHCMIQHYLENITKRYATGIAKEHSYRGDLQQLLEMLAAGVLVTNEPARIACGAPDYILTRQNIPVGYIEAKDIGAPLAKIAKSEQIERYKASLDNLILTDYLDFHLYRNGEFVTSIAIAEIKQGNISPCPQNDDIFTHLIRDFCQFTGQTISSAHILAKMMAGKARMMQLVIEQALNSDDETDQNSSLKDQMAAFKKILIHDITAAEFADMYAQTIAYGMFAARLHDPNAQNFSRQEAAELIPKTNPFLRKLFSYIAGVDIDDRLVWIVDALAQIFRATDMAAFMANFGKATQQHDPIIHFYETFLAEYNPKLRKSRGVWYTPEPVVNFIVRAIDDLLQYEFGLPQGLADISKTGDSSAHSVQILDPAAGTGTFLAEVIKQIHRRFEGQEGIWSGYVETHLIPRLNGFEILMASYAMCHLKLELLLRETGYTPKNPQRLRVFLTNSLEEYHPDSDNLFFANWLSVEANEANRVKRDAPVMVILGNPPYSGESANKGVWMRGLLDDYKKEPGGQRKLQEKNPKWLNDDYVKFLRYGQYFIEKNGEGIVAFINNHGFLDNPTFRGMRWRLLTTFDAIYILDLHGNAKKKETCPDGSPDKNVFDIQQGVSINLFVKTGKKKTQALGKVFHYDLYGERDIKYDFLCNNTVKTIPFQELAMTPPLYLFAAKNLNADVVYNAGFSVAELFPVNSVGIVTAQDGFVIDADQAALKRRIADFLNDAVTNKKTRFHEDAIAPISYRPFDGRFVYYDDALIERTRREVMQHFLRGKNWGLVFPKRVETKTPWQHIFCVNSPVEHVLVSLKTIDYACPLYCYADESMQQTIGEMLRRTPNLNLNIVNRIAQKLELTFMPEPPLNPLFNKGTKGWFAPIDLFDYIYAVLHSPTYRATYNELLKIDFPRVPYPHDQATFWKFVAFGSELRHLHLLEHPAVNHFITTYPQDGENTITRKIAQKDYELTDPEKWVGRVWINDCQYFDRVPAVAWNFCVGGYQPAQKWLKDRQGRLLQFEDIQHYQQMIVALTETHRIMQEIDAVDGIV